MNCIGCKQYLISSFEKGTAKNDELFSCENGCTLLDSKRDPAREIVSFGGRVLGKGYLAKVINIISIELHTRIMQLFAGIKFQILNSRKYSKSKMEPILCLLQQF